MQLFSASAKIFKKNFDLENHPQRLFIIGPNFFSVLPWPAHLTKKLKIHIGNWTEAPSVISTLWLRALYLLFFGDQ